MCAVKVPGGHKDEEPATKDSRTREGHGTSKESVHDVAATHVRDERRSSSHGHRGHGLHLLL